MKMKIKEYFENKEKLENSYNFYIDKKQIIEKENTKTLVNPHLKKADHNLQMFNNLSNEFNDWKIISLYYTLYHACLALVANKNFISKNHSATIIFIIKHYSEFNQEELSLLEELQIKEEDAKFYTELKEERHKANYSTNFSYDDDKINDLKDKTIQILNKIKSILN